MKHYTIKEMKKIFYKDSSLPVTGSAEYKTLVANVHAMMDKKHKLGLVSSKSIGNALIALRECCYTSHKAEYTSKKFDTVMAPVCKTNDFMADGAPNTKLKTTWNKISVDYKEESIYDMNKFFRKIKQKTV